MGMGTGEIVKGRGEVGVMRIGHDEGDGGKGEGEGRVRRGWGVGCE